MHTSADPDRPLAEMMGVAPPEHDIRGQLLVLLLYGCGAASLGASLIAPVLDGMPLSAWSYALPLGLLGLGCAVYVAEGLRRFECWSWFFAMGWLVPPLAGLAFAVAHESTSTGERISCAAAGMTLLGAIHYLWQRRWDFWVQPRPGARRAARRRVTPEWRAARLAGIRMDPARVPLTVSPRPGAFWTRGTRAT